MKLKVERGIPFPKDKTKELVKALCSLKDGDSVFLSYSENTKTVVSNCVGNARYQIAAKGLGIRTVGEKDGRRVWVIKLKK